MKIRMKIRYEGTVQGVGFRPHIFRLAVLHNLKGFVKNDPGGVTVEVEGPGESINKFISESIKKAPVLARIKNVKSEEIPLKNDNEFIIKESSKNEMVSTEVSADASTCEDCVNELFDPKDRRYRYPFINCTNCGPRYTIIEKIPYDRPHTTMKIFKMCEKCEAEYHNPLDRRFHAQPNACPDCGPRLKLTDKGEREIPGDPIENSIKLLREGKIIALKSLGGYQLAVDAENETAVATLRSRKFREDKPFALMARNIEAIEKYAYLSEKEKEVINSPEKPIVILRKREGATIADSVAPRQKNFGFMLPYTPLHHLLLEESDMVLVMTSGNLSDEPIAYKDDEAKARLRGIADYFLTHNRPIHIRCDDSVVRVVEEEIYFIRRARGYVPRPLKLSLKSKRSVLSVGAELKNTFCLTQAGMAIVSHHIGDLDNLETMRAFEEGIEHIKKVFEIEPDAVAYDLHPDYLSTQYAEGLNLPKYPVQHHFAHTASVIAEYGLSGKVIGVSFDGTGFGSDGLIWGGEFLICDLLDFERRAHLKYIPMPGGERAIKEPWRMMCSYLKVVFGKEFYSMNIPVLNKIDMDKWEILNNAIDKNLNSPLCSSMGRLFDAISSLLDICIYANYEGQPAIELEMVADESEKESYEFGFQEKNDKIIIDPTPLLVRVLDDLAKGLAKEKISARFHNGVADMVLEICRRLREESGLDRVCLSGGVFQNSFLLKRVKSSLEASGFDVFIHRLVPTNDGGISLGQCAIALRRMEECV